MRCDSVMLREQIKNVKQYIEQLLIDDIEDSAAAATAMDKSKCFPTLSNFITRSRRDQNTAVPCDDRASSLTVTIHTHIWIQSWTKVNVPIIFRSL